MVDWIGNQKEVNGGIVMLDADDNGLKVTFFCDSQAIYIFFSRFVTVILYIMSFMAVGGVAFFFLHETLLRPDIYL